MKDKEFNYSFQYQTWHSDTVNSRAQDIRAIKTTFETHFIFPSQHDNNKILELGCGMGRLLLMLKQEGYRHLEGVDNDRSQIEIAKREQLNVTLADAKIFLEKNKTTYDVIYAFDFLEHINKDDQLPLLRLIYSHLDANGFLVLQVPNALSPTFSFFRYTDFTHELSYTDQTLFFLLFNSGFSNIAVRPTHQECPEVQRLKLPWARLYRTEFRISKFILTPNIIAVAFKQPETYNDWLEHAPIIENKYDECSLSPQLTSDSGSNFLWMPLKKFLKFFKKGR